MVGSRCRFRSIADGAITALEDSQRTRAAGSPRIATAAERRRAYKLNSQAAMTACTAESGGGEDWGREGGNAMCATAVDPCAIFVAPPSPR